MKRIRCLAAATFAICLTAITSHAQSNLKLSFHAPFAFTAENTTFSAGDYEVTQPDRLILILRNVKDHSSAFEHVQPPQSRKEADGRLKFVFHRYGNEYFLVAVSDGSYQSTYDFRLSKEEKRLADASPRPHLKVVSILANSTVQPPSDRRE
jgi:hypothetical protein